MADYSLAKPNDPPASGWKLRGLVAVAESRIGLAAINWSNNRSCPGLLQNTRQRSYPEEPRSLGIPPAFDVQPQECDATPTRPCSKCCSDEQLSDSKQEQVVDSPDAHATLEAALHSLGHSGTTLCSTASNARPTVLDYHYAYEHGMITPSQVADRVIAFLERLNPDFHFLIAYDAADIRAQAAAATARFAAGSSLSVFDGVPYVVKDCLDALPYETSYGTTFMGKLRPVTADSPCVAALRGLGGMLLGKAALPETGAMGHSMNPHFGATANPQDPTKMAGGSSAGSAAAVAVGLCPIAIGTDGGGSARIPASFCGVVGMKPTKGRLADDHAAHGGYSSTIETCPIAGSVADATLLYAVMANISYPTSSMPDISSNKALPKLAAAAAAEAAKQPPRPLSLPRELLPLQPCSAVTGEYVVEGLTPLKGLRLGVFRPWANDCSAGVADVLKQTLSRLEVLGAAVVDISLPDLDLVQAGHLVTYTSEMAADGMAAGWLKDWSLRSQLNLDTRLFYCSALSFTDDDYTQAQRMRTRALASFQAAFQHCDIIVTPATPTVAPAMPEQANTTGVFDMAYNFSAICFTPALTITLYSRLVLCVFDMAYNFSAIRFTQAANFTGLPALVLPGGRLMGMSLPVGVQFIGKPWAESSLLRTAAALEQQMLEDGLPKPLPGLAINPIECAVGVHPKARELTQKLWAARYKK
ncbi:hypothetical protein OEZ85_001331 [Tetradesmus obliquus]|uniref:Amidase domain-containing protein n=1 Tax=Tetradesmus obliquus TaxID=3088 RepID=A0ABY8URH5_TETOB|nr:hypothetical protein OEZ85_001331 [Tetradesmus obliquus]